MKRAGIAIVMASFTAALVQAGCGDSESENPNSATEGAATASFTQEHVAVGNLLAQTRGHNLASLERYRAGDREAALEHARHPAKEVLDSVRPELEEHSRGATKSLARSLARVSSSVEERAPAARLAATVDAAAAATRDAERAVVGEAAESGAYRGSVIAALVATAAHEYEEALDGDRVARLDEYQDAYGFVREAETMYRSVAPAVAESSAKEAAEIEEAFDELDRALPSGRAPKRVSPLEDVERAAALIGAELEETVGARPATESNPEQVRAQIDRLLDEAVRAYGADRPDEAAELVAEAYLENYEVIEADVIDSAPQVNAKLEPLLGAELRKRIREGAPPEEIASMVKRAKQLLADAVQALEGGR